MQTQVRDGDSPYEGEYANFRFDPRPSSGRLGSPHRFFDSSYDVSFDDGGDAAESPSCSLLASSATAASTVVGGGEIDGACANATTSATQISGIGRRENRYHQVVHRHLNGLCVVTAGNALSKYSDEDDAEKKNQITKVEFNVRVGSDATSARGKRRTKHKKKKKKPKRQKRSDDDDDREDDNCDGDDGIVMSSDPLCRVTFQNGEKIDLRCCVSGTVLELNRSLYAGGGGNGGKGQEQRTVGDGTKSDKNEDTDNEVHGKESESANLSLLLTDPLLDGHLAVIMPSGGTFPPPKPRERRRRR